MVSTSQMDTKLDIVPMLGMWVSKGFSHSITLRLMFVSVVLLSGNVRIGLAYYQ